MDPQKESTLLKYINILGGHDVTKLIHLKSGHFYLYLLNILDYPCNSECKSDEDRLHLVKEFLNDYFCDSAKLNQTICFEKIFNASDFFENPKDIEVELAKVVVLLIAIGAFGDSHEHFISSAVQLPSEMHLDIMAIIQSAIPVDSSQVVLSPQIEQTLRGITGSKKVYLSVEYTKLKNGKAPVMKNSVPTVRGSNTYEETLPVTLCTQEKSVSSKDLEIRALRQQLNNEICLKEELQFLLQDYKSEITLKDSEIISLRKKLKEVIDLQNSYDDLQEMKQKYNQLELNLDRLNKTVQTLHHYKDYSLVLEKENLSLNEEISKLEKEVKTMQLEINKARDLIKIIDKLENQVKVLESQTENMYRFKQECEEVKVSLREALDVNEMLLQEIHQLKEQDKEKELEETMDSFIELQVVELKQQLEEVMCERDALREELSAFRAKPCGMQGGLPLNQLSASTEIENKKEFKVDEKHEGPFNCGVVELLTEMNTELEKELDKIKYSVMKINELSPIGKWQCPEIKQHNLTPVQNESKRKYLNFLDDEVIQEKPNLKNIDEEMSRSMFNLHLEFISLKRIVEESLFKNNDLQLQFFKSLQKQNNIAEVKNSGPNPEFDFISLQSTLLEKKQENSDMIYLFSLLEELKIGSRLSNILRQLEISMKDKVQLEEKHFSDLTPVGVVDAAKLFSMLKEIDNICTQLESKALLLSEMREKENVTLSEMATQTEEDLSLYEINITKLVGTDQYNLAHLTLSDPQSEADVLNDNVFTRLPGDGVGMDNVSHKSKQVSLATRQPLAKYSDAGKNNRSSKRKIKQVSFTFPSIEQFSYIHPKKVYSFLTYVHLSDTRHVKKFRRLKHKIVHNQESNNKSQPRGLLQENHLNSVTDDKAVEITSELNLTEWNTINVDERDVEYHHRSNTTTATSHQENLTNTDLTKPEELAPMLSQPTSKRSGIRRFFSTKKKKDASPKLEHAAPHYDYDDLFFPWPSLLFYFLGGW